ncbi:hypothetical protein K0M31_014067, partial [Melipona bicolor]
MGSNGRNDGPAQKGKPDKPPENINLRSRGREIATWKFDERRFAFARDERDGVWCVRWRTAGTDTRG